ncbi:MAG: choice-of-anchor W domain-containing protein [Gemmatimonadales bacterium]|nr:choice-of-anchor W domain-containing protein [Gemmatimonadales bacterium]
MSRLPVRSTLVAGLVILAAAPASAQWLPGTYGNTAVLGAPYNPEGATDLDVWFRNRLGGGSPSVYNFVERPVGELRIGRGNADRQLGINAPVTCVPVQSCAGGAPYTPGFRAWTNGATVAFTYSRTGNVFSLQLGSTTISTGQVGGPSANAVLFRTRSAGGATTSSFAFSNLFVNGTAVGSGVGSSSAGADDTDVLLWVGASSFSNFSITGNVTMAWTGTVPTGSALAGQIKLLDVPTSVVPEPSTYALLASGLGLIGLVARRRRA